MISELTETVSTVIISKLSTDMVADTAVKILYSAKYAKIKFFLTLSLFG
jgi:hypothetical protein